MPLKVAALVPASRLFAGADASFVAGLRGGLSASGLEHDLVIEPAGNCAVRDQMVDKVQRVLLHHAPDVITGIIGAGMLRHIDSFVRDAETPLLVCDTGADPFMPSAFPSPWLFSNSFNLWQSVHALGLWAAERLGTRAALAVAFHEAGYGIVRAFCAGFESGGGAILATQVTHRASSDEDPSDQLRQLASHEPDFIMGFYSGREGIAFVRAYDALGLSARVPLLATPFMTHGQWRAQMPGLPPGVRTALCWNMQERPDALERFTRAAKLRPDQQPAVFALLGYEAGMFLASMASAGGATLRESLHGAMCDSPRGLLQFDAGSREVATTDYLQELGPGGLRALEPLSLPAGYAEHYAHEQRREDRAGWTNPYLIT